MRHQAWRMLDGMTRDQHHSAWRMLDHATMTRGMTRDQHQPMPHATRGNRWSKPSLQAGRSIQSRPATCLCGLRQASPSPFAEYSVPAWASTSKPIRPMPSDQCGLPLVEPPNDPAPDAISAYPHGACPPPPSNIAYQSRDTMVRYIPRVLLVPRPLPSLGSCF